MRIYRDWEPAGAPLAVALGSFDGLHRGHQAVIGQVLNCPGQVPAVVTFDENPSAVLGGQSVPLLMTNEEKAHELEKMGVEVLYLLPFSHICHMQPERFFERLQKDLQAKTISCGFNFRFGDKGRGDTKLLTALCAGAQVQLKVMAAVEDGAQPVSSTRIRALVQQGNMREAGKLLGRPFGFCFPVEHGRQLGRTLGIPTINQALPKDFIRPPFGVYASMVTVDGCRYAGVTNIGVKPTVGSDHVLSETWILDYQGDLYGQSVPVELYDFLRPERRFDSLAAMQDEILKNAETARQVAGQR